MFLCIMLSNTFETVGKILIGLQFFYFVTLCFLKIAVTSLIQVQRNIHNYSLHRHLSWYRYLMFFRNNISIFINKGYLRERTLSIQEGRTGGSYEFFKNNFVAQETVDLNISWPSKFFRKSFMAPPIIFKFLFKAYLQQYFREVLTVMFKLQITKEVNFNSNIQKIIFKSIL